MKLHEVIIRNTNHKQIYISDTNAISSTFPGQLLEISYNRQWFYNGKTYGIHCILKYVNYKDPDNDFYYNGLAWVFSFKENPDTYFPFSKNPEVHGINDYFYGIWKYSDKEWQAWLKQELIEAGFPPNIVMQILQKENGNGCFYCDFIPIVKSDRICFLNDYKTLSNIHAVVLEKVQQLSGNDSLVIGNSSSDDATPLVKFLRRTPTASPVWLRKNHPDFEHILNWFYAREHMRYVRMVEWLNENTSGNIWVYGTQDCWGMIFFEDKNDALVFKMNWMH